MKCATCEGSGSVRLQLPSGLRITACAICNGTGNVKDKAHVERMKVERAQLAENLVKLTTFTLSPQMEQLGVIDQVLLCKQGIYMAKYLEVLNARIDRA